MRAGRFTQGGALGPRHQDQATARRIGQRRDGRMVAVALFFQSGQRPQTGSIALALLQKRIPGARQLQHPYGMAGRCRIEHDVVIVLEDLHIGEQRGKFVEGRDFGGARSGKLFLDGFDHRFRQHAPHRPDDLVAIQLGGGLRIDFQRAQTGNGQDGSDPVADRHIKHLADVGSRIRADQQDAPALVCQQHGMGAGQRGFPHAAFARKEHERRRMVEKVEGGWHGRTP